MKRVVDTLYGMKGYPCAARFTTFKTDFFANGSTPAITMDTATTNGISVTGATTTAIRVTGSATTALAVLTGTFTTGLSIAAATTGISLSGTKTTGLLIADTVTTAINLTSASTTGISLTGTKTTGISFGASCTTAIDIDEAAATTCAIAIGSGIANGMPMTSTKNGLIRAFGEVQAAATLTNDIRGGWFRVRVNANVDLDGGYQVCGLQGSLKFYGHTSVTNTSLWMNSGVYGALESDDVASTNFASGAVGTGVVGILGLGNNAVSASGSVVAAVTAFSTTNNGFTPSGSMAGVYVGYAGGSYKTFTTGLEIQSASCVTGINIGTTTTAITIAGCTTGVTIVGNVTTGFNLTGNATSAFKITSGTVTNAIEFAAVTNVTNFIKFNAAAGCVLSVDVNPQDDPSDGGLGADGCIRIAIGALDYFIPIFATELS